MAKAGYASRGVIYLIIGGLGVVAAIGNRGETPDTKSAFLTLFETGYGDVLLAALALGLACFALWRLMEAVLDVDRHGNSVKGLAVRGGLLVSALTHSALASWAASGVSATGQGGGSERELARKLMEQPFGRWLLVGAGLCIIGAGIAHVIKGVTRGYEKRFDADERQMRWIRPVSSVGLVARGIVFVIVGGLSIYAGLIVDPLQAGGLRDALQWVQELPFGALLYVAIACGLLCFGSYSFLEACYRRIESPIGASITKHGPSSYPSGTRRKAR